MSSKRIGRTPDDVAADDRDQLGMLHEAVGEVDAVLPAVHERRRTRPTADRAEPVGPVAALGRELGDGGTDLRLVLDRDAAQLQAQAWILANGWAASSSYAISSSVCSSP